MYFLLNLELRISPSFLSAISSLFRSLRCNAIGNRNN